MNAKEVRFVIAGVPDVKDRPATYIARIIHDELETMLRHVEARMHWKHGTLTMRAELPSVSAAANAKPLVKPEPEPDSHTLEDLLCADVER